jgi:plastocyanin
MRRGGYAPVVVGLVLATLGLTGCELKDSGTNVVNGKAKFASACGACHTLARAGTTGTDGPNLDEAFAQARADGFGQSTFKGIVLRQIENPNISTQLTPPAADAKDQTYKPAPTMPANAVTGADARDVAAYVAQAAGLPGKDTGRLGAATVKKASGTAVEKAGKLEIPAAAGGTAYVFADATATAGQITIESKNPQSTGHDIAVTGNGVNAGGKVVQNGGVSTFSADLKPGTYTFYCTVPGHRAAGMQGKLTVK